MSLRFRRSMKLIPGVRLNFNKDSIGMSLGVPGARYTMNSKGRKTFTTGIPGTGIYNVETISHSRRTSYGKHSVEADEYTEPMPKPTLISSKSEKVFYKLIEDLFINQNLKQTMEIIDRIKSIRESFPELKLPLELLAFIYAVQNDDYDEKASIWISKIWPNRDQLFKDPIVEKYFGFIMPKTQITQGISSDEPFNAQALGYIYAEVLQTEKKYKQALEVLHEINPDQITAISIADVELIMGDFDAAIETTEDIENEDDATAMLLVLRGIAFREKGLYEASLECFKRSLKQKDRKEELLHRALFERSETYIRMNRRAMARKDLEKILVDEPNYPEVREKLKSITSSVN